MGVNMRRNLRRKILLLDEDLKVAKQMATQLAKYEEFEVIVEKDISKIDEYIQHYAPHAIILETCYMAISGIEVATYINERYPQLHIIFMTKHKHYALRAFEMKVVDYLVHPITPVRLNKMVRKLHALNEELEMTQRIYIDVLGQVTVKDYQFVPIKTRTKKATELLCFLWYTQQAPPSRDLVIEALWPNIPVQKAIELLHSILYQLRKTLRTHGYQDAIIVRNRRYQLMIDVVADSKCVKALMATLPYEQASVDSILRYYQGEAFEEVSYPWATTLQQEIQYKLRHYFVQVLEQDVSAASKEQVAQHLHRWQTYDEQCVLALMKYYNDRQQRSKIIEVYTKASERIREELGVDMPATVEEMYTYYLLMTPK